MTKKIYYQLSAYQGHRIPGLLNIECLKSIGVDVVETPAEADIVILHDEPPSFPRYFMIYPELKEKYLIAYAVWETETLPELYRHNLNFVDEIWTASRFCEKIFSQNYTNVYVIPHVSPSPTIDERQLKILKQMVEYDDAEFYFYAITKVNDPRKNISTLFRSMSEVLRYRQAKCIVKMDSPPPQEILPSSQQFIYLPFHMSSEMIQALHHIGHCCVSPHHSEGWGLCLSEAMAHENLVVATGYGGNMDFMTEKNSLPVQYQMRSASLNTPWPIEDCQWASVDSHDLVAKLQKSIDVWDDLEPLRICAKKDMEHFSSNAVAAIMKERLQSLTAHEALQNPLL